MRNYAKIILCVLCVLCVLCGHAEAANRYFWETTDAGGGVYPWSEDDSGGGANSNWSSTTPGFTAAAAPVNGDTVYISAGTTCTYDEDMSGWANGVTLDIAATATLDIYDDGGTYYLMTSADITLDGTLQAGTSTSVPFTGTFTIDFNSQAKSIEVSTTGHIYFYCAQPTNRYITMTAQTASGNATWAVDTDVTGDWSVGDTICIVDSSAVDVQYTTIAAGGIAAAQLTTDDNADSNVEDDSIIIPITRNVRIINVAASDYAITYTNSTSAGDGDYIGAEITNCYRVIRYGYGYNFAGTTNLLTTSPQCLVSSNNITVSGSLTGTAGGTSLGAVSCNGITQTSTSIIAGSTYIINAGYNVNINGLCFGTLYGLANSNGVNIASSGKLNYNVYGLNSCSAIYALGEFIGNGQDIRLCDDFIIANTSLNGTSYNIYNSQNGKLNNVSFNNGTEFGGYNDYSRLINAYINSTNHNQVENAEKDWTKGGIVTSQTASPPTGYDIWYELACEDTTQAYPCFRQYETVVLPGTALEVEGLIRIAGGEDLTGYEPRLLIIDKFADPLVDSTQNPLDESLIPEPDGSDTDWQAVSVIWANQGDSPRNVIVRMIAWNDGGVDDVDIDTVWAIASYQDQIADILSQIQSTVPTILSRTGSIMQDTNDIVAKLPDNYIMGSSVTTDKDDEIDAILTDTGTTIPSTLSALRSAMDANFAAIDIDIDNGAIADEVVLHMDANSTQLAAIVEDTGTTIPNLINNLHNFNPSSDVVAHVTLVDTTTTNTDMRGTDGANTTVPDVAGTAASLHSITDALINALNNLSASGVWGALISGFSDPDSFGGFIQDANSVINDKLNAIPTKPSKPSMN